MNVEQIVENIRRKFHVRMDADGDENKPKRKTGGNTRLPYGLCESEGIGTEGMTPREAWEAYYKKTGISPQSAYKAHFKGEKGSGDKDTAEPEKTSEKGKKKEINTLEDALDEEKRIDGILKEKFGYKLKQAKESAKKGELFEDFELSEEEEKKYVDLLNEYDDAVRKVNALALGVEVADHEPKYKTGEKKRALIKEYGETARSIRGMIGGEDNYREAVDLAMKGELDKIGVTGEQEKKLIDALNREEQLKREMYGAKVYGAKSAPVEFLTSKELNVDSISDCTKSAQVAQYMRKKYGIETDASVMTEIPDVNTVKSIASGLENSIKEFPMLKDVVSSVETEDFSFTEHTGAVAAFAYNKSRMLVSPDSMNRINDAIESSVKSKHWPKNTTVESIMAHESAHALEYWIVKNCGKYNGDTDQKEAMANHLISQNIVREAFDNVYGNRSHYSISDAMKKISGYARTDYGETLAEAFGDCYANGDKANAFSKEIKRIVTERVKKLQDSGTYEDYQGRQKVSVPQGDPDEEYPLF